MWGRASVAKSVAKLKQALRSLLPEMDEEEGLVAAAPVMELRQIFVRFWPFARPLSPFGLFTPANPPRLYKERLVRGSAVPGCRC
jgi:hypothetical protein